MNDEGKRILRKALATFLLDAMATKGNDLEFNKALQKVEKVIDDLFNVEMGNFLSRWSGGNDNRDNRN